MAAGVPLDEPGAGERSAGEGGADERGASARDACEDGTSEEGAGERGAGERGAAVDRQVERGQPCERSAHVSAEQAWVGAGPLAVNLLASRACSLLRARTSGVASWLATSANADRVGLLVPARVGTALVRCCGSRRRARRCRAEQTRTARSSGEVLTCTAQAVSAAAVWLVRVARSGRPWRARSRRQSHRACDAIHNGRS